MLKPSLWAEGSWGSHILIQGLEKDLRGAWTRSGLAVMFPPTLGAPNPLLLELRSSIVGFQKESIAYKRQSDRLGSTGGKGEHSLYVSLGE